MDFNFKKGFSARETKTYLRYENKIKMFYIPLQVFSFSLTTSKSRESTRLNPTNISLVPTCADLQCD